MGHFFASKRHAHAHHWMFSTAAMMLAGAGGFALFLNFPMGGLLQSAGVVGLIAAWVGCWVTLAGAAAVMFLSIVSLQLAALFSYGFDLWLLFAAVDLVLLALLWKKVKES